MRLKPFKFKSRASRVTFVDSVVCPTQRVDKYLTNGDTDHSEESKHVRICAYYAELVA